MYIKIEFTQHQICFLCGASGKKNLPANAEDIRDANSIPGLGRSPGKGNSSPLQYSCLENPTDRGAWWTTIHMVAKNRDMNLACTEHVLSTHSTKTSFK